MRVFIKILVCSWLLTITGMSQAIESDPLTIAGVTVEKTLSIKPSPNAEIALDNATQEADLLSLHGSGARSVLFNDVFVLSLYTDKTYEDASQLIYDNGSMVLQFNIISPLVTPNRFVSHTKKGLKRSGVENLSSIQSELDQMIETFKTQLELNDIWQMYYQADKEVTSVYKNGVFKIDIPGILFKQAMLGMWLSETPMQKSLKNDLVYNR